MDHAAGFEVDRTDTIAKITRRLIPFVGIIYLIAYIDRQNVSYAKLEMVSALGLSETAYGLGASLFFIGYFFFEVPSNVILEKVGARRWFARIMISWGLVTIALAYTQRGRGRMCRVARSSYCADWKEPGMDLGGLADKAKNALDSEQGEQRSDQALDKAEQLADEKTGGKYDQQIDKARDLADQRIGQQDPDPSGT